MWRKWSSFLSPILTILALVGAFGLAELKGATKRYIFAWVFVWCVASLLVAPLDYNPLKPAISQTELWRMLFLSPLPILLAVGVKKLVDLPKRLAIPFSSGITWAQPALISAVICAASLPLFLFTTPLIRMISLISGTVAILLVTLRHRASSSARMLILIVLILIIVNAAFSSLFPLLLYPYNA